jgi:RHS repeat-associated protein
VRLARLGYEETTAPSRDPATMTGEDGAVNASTSQLHVFFELGDHLGSTSVVLDKATGELVERSTFLGYGATESDYRPARWGGFREDHKFTGKEEDAEVGLQYFGKRFLNPYLGRWVSADPLEVHAPGEADRNLYAYVGGLLLRAIDPIGLDVEERARKFAMKIARDRADVVGAAHRHVAVVCNIAVRCTGEMRSTLFERAIISQNVSRGNERMRYLPGDGLQNLAARYLQKSALVYRLLRHYGENTGTALHLTRAEALSLGAQVSMTWAPSSPDGTRRRNENFFRELDALKAASAESGVSTVSREVTFSGLSADRMSGGLGTFTVEYTGTLTYHADHDGWEFSGKMRFYDEWDFDLGEKNRTGSGVERLSIANRHLKGTPFAIVGPEFDVKQNSASHEAQWEGTGAAPQDSGVRGGEVVQKFVKEVLK